MNFPCSKTVGIGTFGSRSAQLAASAIVLTDDDRHPRAAQIISAFRLGRVDQSRNPLPSGRAQDVPQNGTRPGKR